MWFRKENGNKLPKEARATLPQELKTLLRMDGSVLNEVMLAHRHAQYTSYDDGSFFMSEPHRFLEPGRASIAPEQIQAQEQQIYDELAKGIETADLRGLRARRERQRMRDLLAVARGFTFTQTSEGRDTYTIEGKIGNIQVSYNTTPDTESTLVRQRRSGTYQVIGSSVATPLSESVLERTRYVLKDVTRYVRGAAVERLSRTDARAPRLLAAAGR
jgi:hypothetical protein